MQITSLPCPRVGHKTFEKSLTEIIIGDTDKPEQISKFVRPYACTTDDLGIVYQPGELQKSDLSIALSMFAYPVFLRNVFRNNAVLFRYSQCRIYQFQTIPKKSGDMFVFGLIITDGSHNLIDFCLDSKQASKRKNVLTRLIRAICTPDSVAKRLHH